jgi:acyl carrier protein
MVFMDFRSEIYAVIEEVATDAAINVGQLDDSSVLVDELGLKSMLVARILAMLEIRLGVDPFGNGDASITDLRTVGDLVAAFSSALRV